MSNGKSNRPILVTGIHRGGTTWIGKVLAEESSVAYVNEPLNIKHRPGVFSPKVHRLYQYICNDNSTEWLDSYLDLLNYKYFLFNEIRSLGSIKDLAYMLRDLHTFIEGRIHQKRILIKDPFAIFSTKWFENILNCEIVVVVRNPLAFVSSVKRLNWRFKFSDLLEQDLLMRDHLEPYRDKMIEVEAGDIVSQASLLWEIIYKTVAINQTSNNKNLLVYHEKFSENPLSEFRNLYSKLNLDFSEKTAKTIEYLSNPNNPTELQIDNHHSIKLNSKANLNNWKKRLTASEIDKIRSVTEETAAYYYPETIWDEPISQIIELES